MNCLRLIKFRKMLDPRQTSVMGELLLRTLITLIVIENCIIVGYKNLKRKKTEII